MTAPSDKTGQPVLSAMHAAQTLAWGPLLFQAAKLMRDRGILGLLSKRAAGGMTVEALASETGMSRYGVTVLVEAGLAARLIEKNGDTFRATRAGYLIHRDPLTRANMNFVADVCYRAAEYLEESIEAEKPVGLKELGDWPTVYDGLSQLGEPARKSWLEFDHFYSDDTFPMVLPDVLASKPKRILDVGGNTGKFALQAVSTDPDVSVTVADLPGQVDSCRKNVDAAGYTGRVNYHPFSVLAMDAVLPEDHDIVWMSQFLSCFSEPEVVHVLKVASRAMRSGKSGEEPTRLFILDNLWDRQKNEVGELCLQATSLYFTCVANGRSRMYDSETLQRLIEEAGLEIVAQRHGIGWGHSLVECRVAG